MASCITTIVMLIYQQLLVVDVSKPESGCLRLPCLQSAKIDDECALISTSTDIIYIYI